MMTSLVVNFASTTPANAVPLDGGTSCLGDAVTSWTHTPPLAMRAALDTCYIPLGVYSILLANP
jgi:hypothetical protein